MTTYHYTFCKCGNMLRWRVGQETPRCSDCGKIGSWRFSPRTWPPVMAQQSGLRQGNGMAAGHVAFAPRIEREERLREWWHQILGRYDRYPSYAVLLALKSDTEATRYLTEFGEELHVITGKSCLVITLSSLGFMNYGSDDEFTPLAIEEHIVNGYCIEVALLFEVRYDQFPCLLLFGDIRKPEHILFSLQGLDAKEIAQEMRLLFSVVSEAVEQDRDPVEAVEIYNKQQAFAEKKKATWSSIRRFAGKTIEMIAEALFKASIN